MGGRKLTLETRFGGPQINPVAYIYIYTNIYFFDDFYVGLGALIQKQTIWKGPWIIDIFSCCAMASLLSQLSCQWMPQAAAQW